MFASLNLDCANMDANSQGLAIVSKALDLLAAGKISLATYKATVAASTSLTSTSTTADAGRLSNIATAPQNTSEGGPASTTASTQPVSKAASTESSQQPQPCHEYEQEKANNGSAQDASTGFSQLANNKFIHDSLQAVHTPRASASADAQDHLDHTGTQTQSKPRLENTAWAQASLKPAQQKSASNGAHTEPCGSSTRTPLGIQGMDMIHMDQDHIRGGQHEDSPEAGGSDETPLWSTIGLEAGLVRALQSYEIMKPAAGYRQLLEIYFKHSNRHSTTIIQTPFEVCDLLLMTAMLSAALKTVDQSKQQEVATTNDQSSKILSSDLYAAERQILEPVVIMIVPSTRVGEQYHRDLHTAIYENGLPLKWCNFLNGQSGKEYRRRARAHGSEIAVLGIHRAIELIKIGSLRFGRVDLCIWVDGAHNFEFDEDGQQGTPGGQIAEHLRLAAGSARHLILAPEITDTLARRVEVFALRSGKSVIEIQVSLPELHREKAPHVESLPEPQPGSGRKRTIPDEYRSRDPRLTKKSSAFTSGSSPPRRLHLPGEGPFEFSSQYHARTAHSTERSTLANTADRTNRSKAARDPFHPYRQIIVDCAVKVDFKAKQQSVMLGDKSRSVFLSILGGQSTVFSGGSAAQLSGGGSRRYERRLTQYSDDAASGIGDHSNFSSRNNINREGPTSTAVSKSPISKTPASAPAQNAGQPLGFAALPSFQRRPKEARATSQTGGQSASNQSNAFNTKCAPASLPSSTISYPRTISSCDPNKICPVQTTSSSCKASCRDRGVCWKDGCKGDCGRVHGRPCPDFLMGECEDSSMCGLSHDGRWKLVRKRFKEHRQALAEEEARYKRG